MRVADEVGVRLVTSLTFSPTNHNSTHYVRTPCVILSVCTLLGEPKVKFEGSLPLAATTDLGGNFLWFNNSPNNYVVSCSFVAKILRIVNSIHPLNLICSEWHGGSANIVLKMYLRAFLSDTYAKSTPTSSATLIHRWRGPPSLKGRLYVNISFAILNFIFALSKFKNR